MKKFRFLPLFLCVVILVCPLLTDTVHAIDDPVITSATAIVVDRDTGEVLFSQNADATIYPASTTKIMTVLLAVEAVESGAVSLDDEVTATANMGYDLVSDGSTAGIMVGEVMSLESLLYCAMISSANEACNIIAEYISGSIPEFIALMNRRASELGCTGTNFVNTHGLPSESHYTTARDMALITLEAASHELFMKISNTVEIEIPATNYNRARQLQNSNALICEDSVYSSKYVYEYAAGIKTGHTNAAGYCLISTTSKDGINLVIGVFGGVQTTETDGTLSFSNFADTITLSDWVFANYSYQEILRSTENVSSVPVSLGADAEEVNLRPDSSIFALLPNDCDLSAFTRQISIYSQQSGQELVAPISAGEALGEISIVRDGVNYGTVKLVASSSVDLSRGQYIKSQLTQTFHSTPFKVLLTIVILVILLYAALVIVYRIRRIRHRRAVRAARLEQARRQREAEAAAAVRRVSRPNIDFFSNDPDLTADAPAAVKPTVSAAVKSSPAPSEADAARKAQAERDYFEEFFKQK